MIYEVNLKIPIEIKTSYNNWLADHISEMRNFDGFLDVVIFQKEQTSFESYYELCVQYHLKNRQTLCDYEQNHAERMRGEGLNLWGTQVQATRRILLPYNLVDQRNDNPRENK